MRRLFLRGWQIGIACTFALLLAVPTVDAAEAIISVLCTLGIAGAVHAAEPETTQELGMANATASSVFGAKGAKSFASNAIDGDAKTAWRPKTEKKSSQWIEFDLGQKVRIERCAISMTPPPGEPVQPPPEAPHARLVFSDKSAVEVDGFALAATEPIQITLGSKTSRRVRLLITAPGKQPLPEFAIAEFSCWGTPRSDESPRDLQTRLDQAYEEAHPGRFRPRPRVPSDCRNEAVSEELTNPEIGYAIVRSKSLVEYYASCGSPCGYSVFVNCSTGTVSDSHWIPIAVDPDREYLLNGKSNKLQVLDIFTGAVVMVIDRPAFRPVADLSYFVDGRFLSNGSLRLWYSDLRGNPVIETVAIP